jgi:hypothetical protein
MNWNPSGCGGLAYDFPMPGKDGGTSHMRGTLADACTSPFNQWAPLAKVLATTAIAVGGGLLIMRSIGGVVGFGATPGGGGAEA